MNPALVLFIHAWRKGYNPLPPPWYVPIDEPACGVELHVPAEKTNDGIERHFVCDKAEHDHEDGKHRQVTDNDEGTALEWPTTT